MRWRSTALSSIFVEMNPRPKSIMYNCSAGDLVELRSIMFGSPSGSLAPRNLLLSSFDWRLDETRANCSSSVHL